MRFGKMPLFLWTHLGVLRLLEGTIHMSLPLVSPGLWVESKALSITKVSPF